MIHMKKEFENALKGDMDQQLKIIKLGELNELTHEDLILFINNNYLVGKIALDW